jgi:hypothetical protein
MTPSRSGRFPLSSAAMKAVARALTHNPESGFDALMAGLRHDDPTPFSVSLRGCPDRRVALDRPLTWLSGAVGSGKMETALSFMKGATRSGYRTVSTSTHNGILGRWRSEERLAINLIQKEADPVALSRALRLAKAAFYGKSAGHLGILLPNLHEAPLSMAQALVPALTELSTLVDGETRLVLSDPGFLVQDLLRIVLPLREAAIKSGSQVIIETCRSLQALGPGVLPEDGQLLMYNPMSADSELSRLQTGEGLLRVGGELMGVDTGYEPSNLLREGNEFFTPPSHAPQVHEVADRIDARFRSDPRATHIGRLELVARACGYRSWHAAQGRSEGRVSAR